MQAAAPGTANRRGRPLAIAKLRSRPRVYIAVVFAALVGAFGLHERRHGVFACPAGGYAGAYLANCHASDYGDFDHGAFWFGLRPEARHYAAAADVLFLGNSRVQYGFSAPSTDRWFTDRGASYYLLGFAYEETARFTGPLLASLKPRARAYVVNADRFFRDEPSAPANEVMNGVGAHRRVLIKAAWQPLHRVVCTTLAPLCGRSPAIYRNMRTGQWRLHGAAPRYTIERADLPVDSQQVARAHALAEPFIASLPVDRRCIVLSYVWTSSNERASAAALAERLGLPFVSPQVEGLTTFDGSHLDTASAERFSRAFFAEAEPLLMRCMSGEEQIAAGRGAPQGGAIRSVWHDGQGDPRRVDSRRP